MFKTSGICISKLLINMEFSVQSRVFSREKCKRRHSSTGHLLYIQPGNIIDKLCDLHPSHSSECILIFFSVGEEKKRKALSLLLGFSYIIGLVRLVSHL